MSASLKVEAAGNVISTGVNDIDDFDVSFFEIASDMGE
jgi:hypothetical protein